MKKKILLSALLIAAVLPLNACASMNREERVMAGMVLGAGAGAGIVAATGGAVVPAVVGGALAGGALGVLTE